MKRVFAFILLILSLYGSAVYANGEVEAAKSMVVRLLPDYANHFEFRLIPNDNGRDCFSIESQGDKIVISGNTAGSMAVGLNAYLTRHCRTSVSWYAENPVAMPDTLPAVPKKEYAFARVERRFFLNYCTFGYSMPFWDWTEWERMIDWMALNGINMPLAITGQETVWYNVWRTLGLSDSEIRDYFTGPVYLPWHRMANIDSWNGPLPMEWLQKQAQLQNQILERERAFGMRPVLPAFSGHVPSQLQRLYPEADIKYLGKWAGFDDRYRCHFLNPEDSLFAVVQRLYLAEQTRMFGTDHVYGVDPFNEVDPPSWEPDYLKDISHNIYRTIADFDPEAEWVQMSWMFYHDRKYWTAPRIEAFLSGVDAGKMTLLDYHCENVELWRKTERFHGQPYIWCYLGNFGGNTSLTGPVKASGARLEAALEDGGDNLTGIGSTLEGLDVMQFPYEYIFSKAWSNALPDEKWIENFADCHSGEASLEVREAWKILFDDVYVQIPRTLGLLPCFRPIFGRSEDYRTRINYDNSRLAEAWYWLLDAPNTEREAIRADLVCVGRQAIGNLYGRLKAELDSAYLRKDLPQMRRTADAMRGMLADLDTLTAYHPRCGVGVWLRDARAYGETKELKDYYERNARNLITTWGGSLNDYAARAWSGLFGSYYAGRWEIYFDALEKSCEAGTPLDEEQLREQLAAFESAWVASTEPMPVIVPKQDLLSFSVKLYRKYMERYWE